jgi:hypothetical protein
MEIDKVFFHKYILFLCIYTKACSTDTLLCEHTNAINPYKPKL